MARHRRHKWHKHQYRCEVVKAQAKAPAKPLASYLEEEEVNVLEADAVRKTNDNPPTSTINADTILQQLKKQQELLDLQVQTLLQQQPTRSPTCSIRPTVVSLGDDESQGSVATSSCASSHQMNSNPFLATVPFHVVHHPN